MAKCTIEFNLPEEEEDLRIALQGRDIRLAISDFLNVYLRNKIKYEEITEEERAIYSSIRDQFLESLEEYEVYLDW